MASDNLRQTNLATSEPGATSVDALDVRLIQLLQVDGRQTSKSLAEQLGTSPSTVLNRMNALLRSRVMRIVAVVDPDRVGLLVTAVIGLDVEPGRMSNVISQFAAQPEVRFVARSTGPYDLLTFALFRSNADLSEFIERRIARMEGIKDTETFMCLRATKGRFAQYTPLGTSLEERLIQLLQKDGRQDSESLARQLRVSPSTVLRRMRDLLGSGMVRIVAVVDLGKVGFPLVTVMGLDVLPSRVCSVVESLAEVPAVKFVSTTTGRFDVMAFLRFRSNEELAQFQQRQLSTMDGIKDSQTILCFDVRKGRYTQNSF
jgi:DNA-binding Lrp family transcriptional regulator